MIRLSVDLDNFRRREESAKVLTVARYTERKGFVELFDAIKEGNFDNVEFYTIGFGDMDLAELAKSRNIQDKVTIFGKMDPQQLSFFYDACDIFCLPSKTTEKEGAEGMPVVLMEAMASEMVIVTTNNGSTTELVNVIVVAEGCAESLRAGLKKAVAIIQDKKQAAEVGRLNREKVMSEYASKNIDSLKEYLYD